MRYMEFFAGLLGKADDLGVPQNNDVDIMKFVITGYIIGKV